jgi:hypothetical protein
MARVLIRREYEDGFPAEGKRSGEDFQGFGICRSDERLMKPPGKSPESSDLPPMVRLAGTRTQPGRARTPIASRRHA